MPHPQTQAPTRPSRRLALQAATALALTGAWLGAQAQAFPSKPIRLLVGFAPGGAVDTIARAVAQQIGPSLGQTVVVENKPGAGTSIAEAGYPGFEASVWYGFIGPAGMRPPVVAQLHAAIEKALAAPEVRERLSNAGGEVQPGPTDKFTQLISSEQTRYAKLIRDASIKPD